MKRIFIFSAVLLAVLVTVSGCSKTLVTNNSKQVGANSSSLPQGQGGRGSRMPDFGQPDRPADIRGIVKSITGNEAIILKVDMKARGGQNASSTPGSDNTSGTQQAPAVSLNGAGVRQGGQGGRNFSGGQGGQGGGTVDRTAMIARLKAMSTGEDTVIIPVGIKMLKSSTETNSKQRTMIEASLSDITPDKSITIWLNSDVTDKKVAEFVLIN